MSVRERSQLYPPHPAVLKVPHHLKRYRQRKARLAAPSRASQSKQAVLVLLQQQPLYLGDLLLAPYEAAKLEWQVVGRGLFFWGSGEGYYLALRALLSVLTGWMCRLRHRPLLSASPGDGRLEDY